MVEVARTGKSKAGLQERKEGEGGEEEEEEQTVNLGLDYHQTAGQQGNDGSNGADVGSSWETCTDSQVQEVGWVWANGRNQSLVVVVLQTPNRHRRRNVASVGSQSRTDACGMGNGKDMD